MNEETFEGEAGLSYEAYLSHGGIVNEKDYRSALERARAGNVYNEVLFHHAEGMAHFSGTIDLEAIRKKIGIDPRALYTILRKDVGAKELEHHHSQMSDQKLFAETLRMLEEGNAVRAVESAYPNIFRRY